MKIYIIYNIALVRATYITMKIFAAVSDGPFLFLEPICRGLLGVTAM